MKKLNNNESIDFSEIDVPPSNDEENSQESSIRISEKMISEMETRHLEKKAEYADRMERHIYKKHGLDLMIGCLVAYGLFVIFDTFTPIWDVKISQFATGFFELLKFVVSTLIGFVFSENLRNSKEK